MKVSFKKVVWNTTLIYAGIGFVIGLLLFIVSFYKPNLSFNLLTEPIAGVKAGVLALAGVPIFMGLVGVIHGVVIWYPFILVANKLKQKL